MRLHRPPRRRLPGLFLGVLLMPVGLALAVDPPKSGTAASRSVESPEGGGSGPRSTDAPTGPASAPQSAEMPPGAASSLGAAEMPPGAASSLGAADRLRDVTSLIGDAECDSPGQCQVVGIGAKPCGGPSGFLAWSRKQTDFETLRAAVEAHAQAERDESRSRGLLSDCRVTPSPAAVCRPRASDGRKTCQLGQGGVRSAI